MMFRDYLEKLLFACLWKLKYKNFNTIFAVYAAASQRLLIRGNKREIASSQKG